MKIVWSTAPRWSGLVLAALLLLTAGCATERIDWTARLGNYTLDQAILDYGPPDKQAKLQDGTTVAEWMTRRGYYYYGHPAYGYYGWYPGWYYSPAYVDRSPDFFLRLAFGPDGKLKAWRRYSR